MAFTLGLLPGKPTCAYTPATLDRHNRVMISRMYAFMFTGSRGYSMLNVKCWMLLPFIIHHVTFKIVSSHIFKSANHFAFSYDTFFLFPFLFFLFAFQFSIFKSANHFVFLIFSFLLFLFALGFLPFTHYLQLITYNLLRISRSSATYCCLRKAPACWSYCLVLQKCPFHQ